MRNRLSSLAAVVLVSAGATLSANHAFAAPFANGAAVNSEAASNVETVRWRRGWGWGVGAGVLGGAIIGSAIANSYYGGPYYGYGPGYYYGPYQPAYGPPPGDAVAYCMSRYKSYDPRSGTFLGYDGLRHPCP
jgi:hypothetical protein